MASPGNSHVEEPVMPPHDYEAESALVAACLLSDGGAGNYDAVADLVEPTDFWSEANRQVFAAIADLAKEGGAVDIVRVATRLRDTGRLSQVGGMPGLAELLNSAPSLGPSHVRGYASTVRNLSKMRSAIFVAQKIAATGLARAVVPEEFAEFAEREMARAIGVDDRGERSRPIADTMRVVYKDAADSFEQGAPPGMPTGLHELDDLLVGGLQRDELMIVAARTGVGKSSFMHALALQIASTVPPLVSDDGKKARRQGVLIFSPEMPADQVVRRMWSSRSRVPLTRIRMGTLTGEHWGSLTDAATSLASLPIELDDQPGIHVSSLRPRIRRARRAFARADIELRLVVVDYLQKVRGDGPNVRGREQEIASICRALAEIAQEEHLSVIAGAQLNRDGEKRGDKRPILADLRESGAIEQDAHTVLFLYRPEYAGETVAPEDRGLTEVIVAKQRNGPPGTARARYSGHIVRFDSW